MSIKNQNQSVCKLTYGLWWFEDDVTAVEHQEACEDEEQDSQSETRLKEQTAPSQFWWEQLTQINFY